VSEYIPEILEYIERIIANGLAYESNESVYFDVCEFDHQEGHHYAKLVPEAYGDAKSLQEGEGEQVLMDNCHFITHGLDCLACSNFTYSSKNFILRIFNT
jgi:cysteinyl-tRNA synthetase